MKIRKNNICFYFSFLIIFVYGVISIFSGASLFPVIGTALRAIPLIILIYYINTSNRIFKAVITAISYVLAFMVSFLQYYFGSAFPLSSSLIASLSSTLYLLPLVILTGDSRKERWISVALTVFIAVLTYLTGKVTVEKYMYLYSRVENYSSYILFSTLTLLLTFLVSVSEMVFRTKNNYLSDVLIASATTMTVLSENAVESQNVLLSSSLYLGVLILLIYVARTREEFDAGERRKIVFSTLRIQEIAPLRKKRKPRVYEIPPNVPTKDAEASPK